MKTTYARELHLSQRWDALRTWVGASAGAMLIVASFAPKESGPRFREPLIYYLQITAHKYCCLLHCDSRRQ